MPNLVLVGDFFGPINDTADMRIVMDPAKIHSFLTAKNGPVMRDLVIRATRVQEAAKKQVRMGHIGAGNRGAGVKARANLRDTIVKRVIESADGMPCVLVGSDNPIALLHHEGTRAHIIRPRNAKRLAFWWGANNATLTFRMQVHHPGTKPNRFLTDNLRLAI